MIRLRLFGSPTIEGAHNEGDAGGGALGLVAQPKRVALLAYLALTQGAARSRDRLLTLFWPESDSDHARAALRQAIHFLRSTLGAEVLESVGRNELLLHREHVWCDAVQFDTQLAAGDEIGALSLYRGDFLESLYVPAAMDLEHWVETQRVRYRASAEAACISVAQREMEKSNLSSALFWANRGELICPTNEQLVRMVMDLTDRLGDRRAALRKYEQFAAWLSSEFGTVPETATAELATRLGERSRRAPAPERRTTPTDDMAAVLDYHSAAATHAGTSRRPARGALMTAYKTDAAPIASAARNASRDTEVVYTADEAGKLQLASEATTQLLGYTPEQLHGRSLLQLVDDNYRQLARDFYEQQVRGRVPTTYYEIPVRTAAGDTVWIGQIMQVIEQKDGTVLLHGVARDVTPARDSLHAAQRLSWRDPVTGLYNADAFVVLADHRRALAADVGVDFEFLSVSIGNLSRVEQERGGTEAERSLQFVAQALQQTFRRSDIIAYIKRNSFAVLGSDWTGAGVSAAIIRLRDYIAAAAPERLGYPLEVTISAIHEEGSDTPSVPVVNGMQA